MLQQPISCRECNGKGVERNQEVEDITTQATRDPSRSAQSLLFFFFFLSLSPFGSAPPSTSLARLFLLFLSDFSSSPFVTAAGVSGMTAVEVASSACDFARALAWAKRKFHQPHGWVISACDSRLTCFLASFRAFFCSLVSPSISPSPSTSIVTSPAGASDFLQCDRDQISTSTASCIKPLCTNLFFFLSFLSADFSSLTSFTISMAAS